jgi:hypothetical protein
VQSFEKLKYPLQRFAVGVELLESFLLRNDFLDLLLAQVNQLGERYEGGLDDLLDLFFGEGARAVKRDDFFGELFAHGHLVEVLGGQVALVEDLLYETVSALVCGVQKC